MSWQNYTLQICKPHPNPLIQKDCACPAYLYVTESDSQIKLESGNVLARENYFPLFPWTDQNAEHHNCFEKLEPSLVIGLWPCAFWPSSSTEFSMFNVPMGMPSCFYPMNLCYFNVFWQVIRSGIPQGTPSTKVCSNR